MKLSFVKTTLLAAFLLAPLSVFATSYTPGQTLDPSCSPSDPTCLVINTTITAANINATSTTATSSFAGGFNIANGGLLYDRSTGFVGIGTTSPSSRLVVAGNTLMTGSLTILDASKTGGLIVGGIQLSQSSNTSNLFLGRNIGINGGQYNSYYNTVVGLDAGEYIDAGDGNVAHSNSFFGHQSGQQTTTGSGNTFVGDVAGGQNTTGSNNTLIGVDAGYTLSTGSGNVVLGDFAGGTCCGSLTTGNSNIIIGNGILGVTTGSNNILLGANAASTTASNQINILNQIYGMSGKTGIGTSTPWGLLSVSAPANSSAPQFVVASSTAVSFMVDQAGNVGIGTSTPRTNLQIARGLAGPYSTYPGVVAIDSGSSNTAANGLEFNAGSGYGWRMATVYNGAADINFKLQQRVATSTWTDSLVVTGSFGYVGIGTSTPTAQLSTTGTVRFSNFGAGTLTTDASGNLSVSSDERLKNIDGSFTRGLSDIMKLSPISYHWNQLSGLDTTTSYSGFSAQNVQTAIPEAVGSSTNGFLTLQDRPILAATVNAIKDIGSVTGIFKDNLVAWLGNSSNGIQNFYTDNIHAKRADVQTLCIGSTCVTEAQLQQLLQNQNGIGGTPVVQPSNDSTSTVEESTSTADVATSTQL